MQGTEPKEVEDGNLLPDFLGVWDDLKVKNTMQGRLIFKNNLLVQPKACREALLTRSYQANMNHTTLYNNCRKV